MTDGFGDTKCITMEMPTKANRDGASPTDWFRQYLTGVMQQGNKRTACAQLEPSEQGKREGKLMKAGINSSSCKREGKLRQAGGQAFASGTASFCGKRAGKLLQAGGRG